MTKIIVKKEIAWMTQWAILTKSSNWWYWAHVNNSPVFDEILIHEDFIELLPDYFMKDEWSVWNEDWRYLKAEKQATVWIISQEWTIYNRTANQEMCDKIASWFLRVTEVLMCTKSKNEERATIQERVAWKLIMWLW